MLIFVKTSAVVRFHRAVAEVFSVSFPFLYFTPVISHSIYPVLYYDLLFSIIPTSVLCHCFEISPMTPYLSSEFYLHSNLNKHI